MAHHCAYTDEGACSKSLIRSSLSSIPTDNLDVDVLDPSLIPAVNYPTPGGLSIEEALSLLSKLFAGLRNSESWT